MGEIAVQDLISRMKWHGFSLAVEQTIRVSWESLSSNSVNPQWIAWDDIDGREHTIKSYKHAHSQIAELVEFILLMPY